MGFDSNGRWTSDFYPINDRDNNVPILASKFQALIQTNLKQSFENCLLRDGTGLPRANINWNGQKIINLAPGTADTDAVTKGQMDEEIASEISSLGTVVPVGAIFPAPVSALEGYLLCNGQEVSRTTYNRLFALLGVNFGGGDGISTFNVPDYRGCFLRGFDNRVGSVTSSDMFTKQNSGVPNITGTFGSLVSPYPSTGAFSDEFSAATGQGGTGEVRKGVFNASASSNVYQDGLTEARPVNYSVNYFIKY